MGSAVPSATVFDEDVLQERSVAPLAGAEQPPLPGNRGPRVWAHRWRRRMGVVIGTNRARQYVPVAELQEKARAFFCFLFPPVDICAPTSRSQNRD